MSIFYKTSNREDAKDLYEKKLIYDFDIEEPEYGNLINFYFAERYMYGRVNYSYIPITPDFNSMPLSTLDSTNTERQDFMAATYVVDAFNDLNRKFKTKALDGSLFTGDDFLATLEVKKAYQDPRRLYSEYLNQIQDAILEVFVEDKVKFSNFDQFKVFFYDVINRISKQMPITYPGFVKSRFCPMNVSGLVIEIADISYEDDEEKILKFKNSPNWEFYLNACRSYGFWVDSSNPFRLVANIGSPEMLEYARTSTNCGFTSTYDILSTAYKPAYFDYEADFRAFALTVYNLTKIKYLNTNHCLDGTVITKIVEPEEYTLQQLDNLVPDLQFLTAYINLRFNEENTKLKDFQKKRITSNTINEFKKEGLFAAMVHFSKFISSTYDYSGSLTDLIRRDKLIKQERNDVFSDT